MSTYKKFFVFSLFCLSFLLSSTKTFATEFAPSSCGVLSSTDLTTEMTNQIDSRIVGLSTSTGYMSLYSTRATSTGIWTKNTNVWTSRGDTPLDFSGQSVWNSTGGYTKSGTMISPRHIVFANHYPITNGATMVFIDRNGSIVTRILSNQVNITGTDIKVGILNEDIPDTVAYYPIISEEQINNYLNPRGIFPPEDLPIPMVTLDQDDDVIIRSYDFILDNNMFETTNEFLSQLELMFFNIHIDGDSGNPGFFVVNNQLILNYIVKTPMDGEFYGSKITELNSIMSTLQGGSNPYQVLTYDMSCFEQVEPLFNFSIDEMYDVNSTVGLVTGTSTRMLNVGDVVSRHIIYSIVSSTIDNAFSISSSTGEIKVINSSLLDYETDPIINLTVQGEEILHSSDDSQALYYSYTPVRINLNDIVENINFVDPPYSFLVNEHSTIGAVVGTVTATSSILSSTISYSITSGNTNNIFAINSSTGVVTVANSELLDYDNYPTFSLNVRATDSSAIPNIIDTTVTINLTNISVFTASEDWLYNRSVYRDWMANGYAWGENIGWIKISPNTSTKTYVGDNGLSGYMYSESAGWISMSCRNTDTCDFINYGVLNDGIGNLSGYAWGENIGWIHFGSSTSPYRVLINSEGLFSGYAYSESVGYINFGVDEYSATTTWRYKTGRSQCDDGVDNDNDTRIDYPNDNHCSSLTDDRERSSNTSVTSNINAVTETIYPVENSSEDKKNINNIINSKPQTPPIVRVPENSPTPSPSFTTYLKLGSEGAEVTRLQNFLIAKGYPLPSSATGYFGGQTQRALSSYQRDNNITPTGTFGPITRNYINNNTPTQTPTNTTKFIFNNNLKLNDISEDVRQLQIYLNNNGFTVAETGPGSKGNESTFYGQKTVQAVKKLQEAHRSEILTPSGLTSGTGMFYESTRKFINNN